MSHAEPSINSNSILNTVLLTFISALVLFTFLILPSDTTAVNLVWLVPIFPIITFIVILLFGHLDSRKGGTFALVGIGFSSFFSLAVAYDVFFANAVHGSFLESTRVWFEGQTFAFEFGTYIDSLAALLLFVVGLVSYLVVVLFFATLNLHSFLLI